MQEPPANKSRTGQWAKPLQPALDRAVTIKAEMPEDSQAACETIQELPRCDSLEAETLHMSGSEPDLVAAVEAAARLEAAAAWRNDQRHLQEPGPLLQGPAPVHEPPLQGQPAVQEPPPQPPLQGPAPVHEPPLQGQPPVQEPPLQPPLQGPAPIHEPPSAHTAPSPNPQQASPEHLTSGNPISNLPTMNAIAGVDMNMMMTLFQTMMAQMSIGQHTGTMLATPVHLVAPQAPSMAHSLTVASLGSTDSLVEAFLQADSSATPEAHAATAGPDAAKQPTAGQLDVEQASAEAILPPTALAALSAEPMVHAAASAASASSVSQPPPSSAPIAAPAAAASQPSAACVASAAAPSQPPLAFVALAGARIEQPGDATDKCGSDAESSSSSDDGGKSIAHKRKPRARYMRFWRSIQAKLDGQTPVMKKTPVEVIEAAMKVKGKKGGLTALYEDFLQSKENWQNSCLMHRISKKRSEAFRGRFAWLTRKQLLDKYGPGSEPVVDDLIRRKVPCLANDMPRLVVPSSFRNTFPCCACLLVCMWTLFFAGGRTVGDGAP